jgi:tRNA-modifying protein YgfZ
MPFRLDRALLRVSGPDAAGFLDNLLTQDVTRLDEAGVLYAALLTPQGKVVSDLLLWPDGDGAILETDMERSADLLRRLSMYKLRANATLKDITGEFGVLWSPEAFGGGQADPRFPDGALGWREVCRLPSQTQRLGSGAAAFEARRLAVGVPDLARDAAPEEVFALEALLEELNGVDFQKGCFVGQENVSRMKRRATTRKKFCPVVFDGDPPPSGAAVLAGEAEVGSIRSGLPGRAIALLRLDRALAARDAGAPLMAGTKEVRLDPPSWLQLPARDA